MKYLLIIFLYCMPWSLLKAQSADITSSPVQATTTLVEYSPTLPRQKDQHDNTKLQRAASGAKFGFRAGVNYSNMNFNKGKPAPATPVEAAWNSGAFFGGVVQIPIAGKLSLRQEYLLSRRRGEDKRTETRYRMHYFSMPVLLKYSVLPRFSVVAGPQFELLVRSREFSEGSTFNSTHFTEERSIGLTAGLEFAINKHVSLSSRFMHGFNHIGIGGRPFSKEFKYEVIQLSADFLF
jgi:hypothetical protein